MRTACHAAGHFCDSGIAEGDRAVVVIQKTVTDVDLALMVVEPAAKIGKQEEELLSRLKKAGAPVILAINKTDTVSDKRNLLEVIALYSKAFDFDAIIPISAKTGDGTEELTEEMTKYAVEGPWLFPGDMITDQPERQICAEYIRKKVGERSRKDREEFLDVKVNLQTWVKVRENWRDSAASLRNFGYNE